MSDLFEEIKEDIKQEKFAKLWKEYGNYILLLFAAIIIGASIFVWQKNNNLKNRQLAGDKFVYASQTPDPKKSIIIYDDVISNSNLEDSTMALLQKAARLRADGDIEGALSTYKSVMLNDRASEDFRQLATLSYIHTIINNKVEIENFDIVENLNKFDNNDNPWRYLAKELLATYYFVSGDIAKAKENYQNLLKNISLDKEDGSFSFYSDNEWFILKNRINEMLAIIG